MWTPHHHHSDPPLKLLKTGSLAEAQFVIDSCQSQTFDRLTDSTEYVGKLSDSLSWNK